MMAEMSQINSEIKAIFFPRFILYIFFSHFCSFTVFWGFGVRVLNWVLGLWFSVDGILGLWCKASWGFWGWGSLYKFI